MVGASAAGIQQAHGIAFVAKGGLHPHKNVAEVTAVNQQVLPVAVEVARGLAPVLLQSLGVRGETFVLLHAHAMSD